MLSTGNEEDIITCEIDGEEYQLMGKSFTDEFYQYSVYADELLISLYGPHPRNFISSDNTFVNVMD